MTDAEKPFDRHSNTERKNTMRIEQIIYRLLKLEHVPFRVLHVHETHGIFLAGYSGNGTSSNFTYACKWRWLKFNLLGTSSSHEIRDVILVLLAE